ncbi:hypothetical protein KY312_03090 [Candidatus Woesearchaeota archaeon]|nr:hypothetical protein [Candidatus Woesearchaeota archaeon]
MKKEIAEELIKEIGRSSERWGLSSVLGEVWGTLYFKGEMTQEELRKQLGIGLSSISQSIKVLESLGFISPIRKQGRKNVYKADFSTQQFGNIFEKLVRFELTPMISLLASRKDQAADKNLKEKISKLQGNMKESAKILSLFLKFKK